MSLTNLPPLLLDNERLRELMREREHWQPEESFQRPALVSRLVKPAMSTLLASLQHNNTRQDDSVWPQQEWPAVLRQLHWELCSSTQLRPIARIMNRTALLPDPFVIQGGLWHDDQPPPAIHTQHPQTRLYTALRLDLVLAGNGRVHAGGNEYPVTAGDAVLADAQEPLDYQFDGPATLWTAFFYSPEVCCCHSADNKGHA